MLISFLHPSCLYSRWCEGCGEDWGKREKVWGKQEEDASDEQGWRLFLNTTFNLELFKCRGKKKRYTTFNNSFFFLTEIALIEESIVPEAFEYFCQANPSLLQDFQEMLSWQWGPHWQIIPSSEAKRLFRNRSVALTIMLVNIKCLLRGWTYWKTNDMIAQEISLKLIVWEDEEDGRHCSRS